jgi:hypothetical protein
LVITALLGVLTLPAAVAAEAAGITLVTVCSEDGAHLVALDDNGVSVPLPKSHCGKVCACCLPGVGTSLLPAGAAVLSVPLLAGAPLRRSWETARLPEPHFLIGRPTRAPPAQAG